MGRRFLLPIVSAGAALLFLIAPAASQSNEDCLGCHQDQELKTEAGKSMYLDMARFLASSHGQAGISCVDCHTDLRKVDDFPHRSKLRPADCGQCHEDAAKEITTSAHFQARDEAGTPFVVGCAECHGTHEIKAKDDFDSPIFPLNLPSTCEKCHLEKIESDKGPDFIRQYNQSVHFKALDKSGLTMSANCSHCHGGHDIKRTDDPLSLVSRKNIIRTCGRCHVGIERGYLEGVHGKDYVKGINDVPVCTDCHSEHDILSPQDLNSKVYATKVADVCSRCHDDMALSRQYGFLTSRLKTYSQSFHGTASKFGETRVANCASCHGFHDIRASSDPKSSINPENLPRTCGQCHPGASRRFAEGQIHFIPAESVPAKYRSSHIIKNIYIIVIAVIIGIMIVFITADFLRRLVSKERHG
jgi:predicted CXXCH cytochrome family protein